jgi:ribonuclease VapC
MVIDSSALIAILEQEIEAELFLRLMYESDTLKISTVTYTEVSLVVYSRFGDLGVAKLDELLAGLSVEFIAFDKIQAQLARLAWQQYGKGRHPAKLNFGDCCSYALAKHFNLPLLFKGNDFIQTDIRYEYKTTTHCRN